MAQDRWCLQPLLWFTLTNLFLGASAVDHVPVLVWSTFGSLWNLEKKPHEGHIIKNEELQTFLKPIFNQGSQNVVLFLQNELSVEDFTQYGPQNGDDETFGNVQQFLETSNSSLVLPAVDWRAIKYLKKNLTWTKIHNDLDHKMELEMDPSKPNLIVVKLAPVDRLPWQHTQDLKKAFVSIFMNSMNNVKMAQSLSNNDKVIGETTNTLIRKGVQFSAIYTALRPSVVIRGSAESMIHTGRRLMASDSTRPAPYPPVNVTNGTDLCILFYATSLQLMVNGTSIDLTNETFISRSVDTDSSMCSTANATLSLKYSLQQSPSLSIKTLEIRFLLRNRFYTVSARYWFTLDFVEILQDEVNVGMFNVSSISAPHEYSFHCQLVGTSGLSGAMFIPANDAAEAWTITISEFQIQGFNVEDNRFAYASDCSSFFTRAIWMALVTSLILLYILTFGIHMIMHLTTNDRFDDPKGQALIVPQTD